jgi:hypothetical protein
VAHQAYSLGPLPFPPSLLSPTVRATCQLRPFLQHLPCSATVAPPPTISPRLPRLPPSILSFNAQ